MGEVSKAYLSNAGESERRWMGKTFTDFLATGAHTDGAFALVEERAPRGVGAPLHKHDDDRESFYLLEGEVSFYLGGEPARRATAGAFVHIPAGTIHGFRIESPSARYLILTTPRHADFYRAITVPDADTPVDGAVVNRACSEYGIDFVGPLPEA